MTDICAFHTHQLIGMLPELVRNIHDQTDMLIRMERRLILMTSRESAAWQTYQENVQTVVAGYRASRALNEVYVAEINRLHKNQQEKIDKAVQEALDSDSDADFGRIEAADESLNDVLTLPPMPEPERPKDSVPTDTVPDPETGVATPPNPDPTSLPGEHPDAPETPNQTFPEQTTPDSSDGPRTPDPNGQPGPGEWHDGTGVNPDENGNGTGPADGGSSGSENVSFGDTGSESNAPKND